MSENAEGRVDVRLMNAYGGDMPLWLDGAQPDGDELGISDPLRDDLLAFAARWEAAIPAEVFDDRYTGVPVMQSLVSARYALKRLHPGRRRQAKSEDAAMRELGADLRDRLERELGPGYRVTYQH